MKEWPAGYVLNQRYQILKGLQQRDGHYTYWAIDSLSQQEVIVKSLNISQIQDWQAYQQYERELEVLAKLQHDRIPALLDHFDWHWQEEHAKVLVLQAIHGQTLQERLKLGWKVNEEIARNLAEQALEILKYLHEQSPPLVHRDIKPANLLLNAENQLYLLDFGAARSPDLSHSVTVAGTFGYMAPEQALGQPAQPNSDLYALGMTLVELLTHLPPQQIPRKDLHLDFQGLLNVSPAFQYWLEQLLEPDSQKRVFNAQQALNKLKSQALPELGSRPSLQAGRLQIHPIPTGLLVQIIPASWKNVIGFGYLKVLFRALGFSLLCVFLVWCVYFSLYIGLDLLYLPILQDILDLSAPWIVLISHLFILEHFRRQIVAPLRTQSLRFSGTQLEYSVQGWLSARKKKFDLLRITSCAMTDSGLEIERAPLPLVSELGPLLGWLSTYIIPMPLSQGEQQEIQRALKRHIRQQLPPETAQNLLSNSF